MEKIAKATEIETLKYNIEILKDFIDETLNEIQYHVGYHDDLYREVYKMRNELLQKLGETK